MTAGAAKWVDRRWFKTKKAGVHMSVLWELFCYHSSRLEHSTDSGCYLQTNDASYEILRYFVNKPERYNTGKHEPDKCRQVTNRNKVRNLKWHSYTTPLGWGVQGVWPSSADGSDINAVDRSPSMSLVATADDFGDVKIFANLATAGASCKSKKDILPIL